MDGSYYVGQTHNVEERLLRHNKGYETYTKNKTPWNVVYTESFDSRDQAVRRETEIKSKKSRKYIEWLITRSK
jgi:putative endonuclease